MTADEKKAYVVEQKKKIANKAKSESGNQKNDMAAKIKAGYSKMTNAQKKAFDALQDKITKFRDADDKKANDNL